MPDNPTINDLFEVAIAAERAAEALYDTLHDRFAAHEAVAHFWRSYAREEAGHARRLERIRDQMPAGNLSLEADAEMLEMARRNLSLAQRVSTAEILTMDDAYQLAHELEHSEVNTILELLVADYAGDAQAVMLVRTQLRDHIEKLMTGFPAPFNVPETRRAVRPA
ncbi:MAG: hypothetical protein JXA93_15195 [Anaerolineae bacterium]|nr:hypothetical protein [Anaerolineae bacterium]